MVYDQTQPSNRLVVQSKPSPPKKTNAMRSPTPFSLQDKCMTPH